jgi:hypothetical protein
LKVFRRETKFQIYRKDERTEGKEGGREEGEKGRRKERREE